MKYDNAAQEKKKLILQKRLEGYSTTHIAALASCSRQYVHSILKKFKLPENVDQSSKCKEYIPLPLPKVFDVLLAILNNCDEKDVCKNYKITIPQLHRCYHLVTDRNNGYHIDFNHEYFPELEKWRLQNKLSVSEFAVKCDCQPTIFEQVLSGRRNITYELALRIEGVTGIKIKTFMEKIYNLDKG